MDSEEEYHPSSDSDSDSSSEGAHRSIQNESGSEDEEQGEGGMHLNLQAIFQRILANQGRWTFEADDDAELMSSSEDEGEAAHAPVQETYPNLPRHHYKLKGHPLVHQIGKSSGAQLAFSAQKPSANIQLLLQQRRGCQRQNTKPGGSRASFVRMASKYLPSGAKPYQVDQFDYNVFCGTYSASGASFMSACQDGNLRLYDTSSGGFEHKLTVSARDVGWSIIDTCYSPNEQLLIYSSWSNAIQLITLDGERHEALTLAEEGQGRMCPFSIRFSSDSRQVICGTNYANVIVYDCPRDERVIAFDAHEDDVNAVCFADHSSNVLVSGSDDCLCKVWDRRTMSNESTTPLGVFRGHKQGVTFLDASEDERYIISQGKDQCIKLWDLRKMSSASTQAPGIFRSDYRYGPAVGAAADHRRLRGDTSLMTYTGHQVARTLIRARFSPSHTTGQK